MWGSLLSIGAGLLGASSSGNQQQQQTQSRDPWEAAQPWMRANLGLGQELQSQYMRNPLSDYQKQSYAISADTNNRGRNLTNGLLGQLNNFTGWTRQAPGKVTPFNFSAGVGTPGQVSGNLGFSVNPEQAQYGADLRAQIEALKAQQLAMQQAAAQRSAYNISNDRNNSSSDSIGAGPSGYSGDSDNGGTWT